MLLLMFNRIRGRSFGIYLDEKENWYIQDVVHEALPSSQIESEVAMNAFLETKFETFINLFRMSKDFYMLEGREGKSYYWALFVRG